MRKIFLVILLFASMAGARAQSKFSIKESIDHALQNNIAVKNSVLDKEATDSHAKSLHAHLLPQVDAGIDYVHNFNIQKIILENGVIPAFSSPELPYGAVEAFQLQLNNVLTGSISINQVIFDRSLFAGLKNEENLKQLSDQQIERTRIEVAEQVIKAYYGVLVAQKQYDFLVRNLARVGTLYRETQARLKSGVSRQIDLDRIEVRFNNLKQEQEKAKQIVDLSFALLRYQMNLKQSEQIQLTDSLNETLLIEPLDSASDYAYSQRIDYAILSTQKKIELSNTGILRSGYFPKLNAFATTGYNPAATQLGDIFQNSRYYNYTFVGVRLSIPVFHGSAKKRELATRHIQLQKIENSISQTQQQIDLQVEQAKINLLNNIESLKTQKRNLQLAEENVRVIRIENEKGVALNIEVTNAEADLKEAQTNYYHTLYQSLLSKVDLDKARGRLLE